MAKETEYSHVRNIELDNEGSFARQKIIFAYDLRKLPDDMIAELVYHGVKQKVGDAASGKEGADAQEAMEAVWANLVDGLWGKVRSSKAADPFKLIRKYIRSWLREHNKGAITKTEEYKVAESKSEFLDTVFDAQDEATQGAIVKAAQAAYDAVHNTDKGVTIKL